MNVQLKVHTKLKVGDVPPGKTFRLINQMKAYQVLDIQDVLGSFLVAKGETNLDVIVFAVDLATGQVGVFAKETEVYLAPLQAVEKDE